MIKFLNEARYKTQSDHSEDDMLSNLDERVSVSSGKIKHNVRGIFKDKREMPTNQSIMGKRRI